MLATVLGRGENILLLALTTNSCIHGVIHQHLGDETGRGGLVPSG